MKKLVFLTLIMALVCSNIKAQLKMISNGKIVVGDTSITPISNLDIAGYMHVSGNTSPTVTAQGGYLNWNALTGGTGETDLKIRVAVQEDLHS